MRRGRRQGLQFCTNLWGSENRCNRPRKLGLPIKNNKSIGGISSHTCCKNGRLSSDVLDFRRRLQFSSNIPYVNIGYFYARQHIFYSAYMLSPVHLFVCLSVTRVDHTKTVEVKITKFSPYGSPIHLLFAG